jgi:dolichol-phosphate mannosyltransferase
MFPERKLTVDLVMPIFNEAGVIERIYEQVRTVVDGLPYDFHFYYVDDGSTDGTADSLLAIADQDPRVAILTFSRNFGHQAALTAGLEHSMGEIIITMDGDGQHPPEMIPQMIDLCRQGYDIVQAQRIEGERGFSLKQATSSFFYKLINTISGTRIEPGAADFRAMSRQAVDALRSMPEYHRFLRGMIAWMGFKSAILPYHEPERVAGRSKYSFGKMFRLAMDALFSFSLMPLYIGMTLGGILLCLAAAQIIYVLSFWFTGRSSELVPGWSSLMSVLLVLGGMLMILLGFIGVYVGYIFQEVKKRPVYLLKKDTTK